MALKRETYSRAALAGAHCGYSIRPRADFLWIEHCPRCLAKRRVAVPLRENAEPARRTEVRAAMRGQQR